MDISALKKEYDKLQIIYGSKNLKSIHFGGQTNNPNMMLIFMNPTKSNIASHDGWTGVRAPWIGTKNMWKLLNGAGLFCDKLFCDIQSRKASDWNAEFAELVYDEVFRRGLFITNLGKCTQDDARPLPDLVFNKYVDLLFEEIALVNPKIIVTFGNQVSSIVIGKKIEVSKCRKVPFTKNIKGKQYDIYPLFYPVGQGMRNISKSIEDLEYIKTL